MRLAFRAAWGDLPGAELPGAGQEPVGVAGRIGVEADHLTAVVDTVQGGGADAVRVIDGLEAVARRPGEPVHHGRAAAAHRVDADNLIPAVDAERLGHGRTRNAQRPA